MSDQKTRILIIDDDLSIGDMLKTLLEFKGYEVFVSDKPLEIKEKIQKHHAELVLLDMRLSGVMGTDVCERLKKDEVTRDVPILMMSALSNAGKTCKASGADDFITKPFEMDDLLAKIQEMLSKKPKKDS